MTERNEIFTSILKNACSGLNLTIQEIKDKYKDYSICVMEYINSGKHDNGIEIYFDKEAANIIFTFNEENICDYTSIYFDDTGYIDLFVDYLIEAAEYSFRKSCWLIDGCFLKIKEVKKEVYFCCCKE